VLHFCRVYRTVVGTEAAVSVTPLPPMPQGFGRAHLESVQGIAQQGILGTSFSSERLGRVHDRGDIVETRLRARIATEASCLRTGAQRTEGRGNIALSRNDWKHI
jgi:hypothetical protein